MCKGTKGFEIAPCFLSLAFDCVLSGWWHRVLNPFVWPYLNAFNPFELGAAELKVSHARSKLKIKLRNTYC